MSVPALTAAMLLAGAPVNTGSIPPAAPISLADPSAHDQEGPASAAPLEPAPPIESPSPTEPAAPTPSSGISDTEDEEGLVVTGRRGAPASDPLEGVNATSYAATQAIDKAFIRPVALTYQRILPDPVRSGIRNVINNLREPVAFLAFLLQLKPGKAAETAGRFVINTTIGGAGLFDFAKRRPFNLPRRPNGLANTLGYYGVKPGPFLFVPLVGPTTLRDFLGDGLDRLVLPLAVGKPFNRPAYAISSYVFNSLDQRAEFNEKLEELHSDRADPYAATREDYLRSRQAAIDELHGKHPDAPSPAIKPVNPSALQPEN